MFKGYPSRLPSDGAKTSPGSRHAAIGRGKQNTCSSVISGAACLLGCNEGAGTFYNDNSNGEHMRERVDIDQFRRQPHESTVSEDDSLATKVRKLRSRGLSAEKIADKLYLGRDLYSGETVRDQHWQKLKREIDAICGGMECQ